MITPEELQRIGCNISPSGECFYLWLDDVHTLNKAETVILGCFIRGEQSTVYLKFSDSTLYLPHIDSIAKFCALYSLLTGQAKA